MTNSNPQPWKMSLHGGHSGKYCDHAQGELRDFLKAAVAQGFQTYAVTEHAPRTEARFLFTEEIAMGWDVPRLMKNFEDYAEESRDLAEEFTGQLVVLRGFEAEVVPTKSYAEAMKGHREKHSFDFMVGSVHFVNEMPVDYTHELFDKAAEAHGRVEALALAYYQTVAEMVEVLRPEVVGHLDVIRKFARGHEGVQSEAVRKEAERSIDRIVEHGCIVDINTAGFRQGHGMAYPAPWLLQMARDKGARICLGDDSHAPDQVGADFDLGRRYLIENGIKAVTILTRENGRIVTKTVPL